MKIKIEFEVDYKRDHYDPIIFKDNFKKDIDCDITIVYVIYWKKHHERYFISKKPDYIEIIINDQKILDLWNKYHIIGCPCGQEYDDNDEIILDACILYECFQNFLSNIIELDDECLTCRKWIFDDELNFYYKFNFAEFLNQNIILERFGKLIPKFINYKNTKEALELFKTYDCISNDFIEFLKKAKERKAIDKINFSDAKNFIIDKFDSFVLGQLFEANIYSTDDPIYTFELAERA